MKKRITALLMALALCIGLLPAGAFARETDYFGTLPSSFDFVALRFDASCTANTESVCAAADSLLQSGAKPEKLYDMFMQILALRAEMQTQLSLISILYYGDPASYGSSFSEMSAATAAADRKALLSLKTMLADPGCGAYITARLDNEQLVSILGEGVPTQAQLDAANRETALVIAYQQAASRDTAVTANGKSWTLDSVTDACRRGDIAYADYLEILYSIYAARAEELGAIYLQMVTLRNEIARSCGYAAYPEYAYAVIYGRDYTTAEAAAYRSAVKANLLPLLETMYGAYRNGVFADGTSYDGCSECELLDAAAPYLEDISSELADAFAYMRDCDLIDAEYSATKLPVSFTTYLPGCRAPYILCSRRGGNQDLGTVIHEFGHFNAMCYGAHPANYDTLEVHSQGLEALMLHYADALYGSEAQAQTGYTLFNLLYLVLAGCCFDEFQEYAYTAPSLSVDDLCRKSAELFAEYGLTPLGPKGLDYGWTTIPHTFESPMYYISYSTSAIAAMELYLNGCLYGKDAAADQYLSFVSLSAAGKDELRTLMMLSGLGDPFAPGFLQSFAAQLERCLDAQVYHLPYSDVDGLSAKGDITLLYLLGVMNGTSASTFSPDAALSRAMAVTVLYRAFGCPPSETDASAVFSDVARDSWYADAVGWAVEKGITNGTSASEFSPDKTLTCQEFAVMMYRCLFGMDASYPDGCAPNGTAAWAVDAMKWSRDAAIFESERGEIPPTETLSRAELASALVNLISY